MKFFIKKEDLIKPLQKLVIPFGSRSLSIPILGCLLLKLQDNYLYLIGTDLDIEIVMIIILDRHYDNASVTIPTRKFFDICRFLPENAQIIVTLKENKILISSGNSIFFLSTLPASDFPNAEIEKSELDFVLPQYVLKKLIKSTQFSMGNQDVRYYLNSMLLEVNFGKLYAVSTDGHRLSLCSAVLSDSLPFFSVIIPRKGVISILRMLDNKNKNVTLKLSRFNICLCFDDYIFTSKLIDGSYPDYSLIFQKTISKTLHINCFILKQAIMRVSIVADKKFYGVRFFLSKNILKVFTNNTEYEKAEEILRVTYEYPNDLELGLNINYILDVLNVIQGQDIRLLFTDDGSSIQIEDCYDDSVKYVIMSMKF